MDDHNGELTTEKPQNIHPEVQQIADEAIASDEEEKTGERLCLLQI